ncbi:hypothetical protein ACHQM5_025450 [Ranunculus cassubicifolius]
MGRRKERRAAASMASGRRVKLDLFADNGEEGDVNRVKGTNSNSKSPSPSSSSGKRQDNPLLLLGQYSDEDENEEAHLVPAHQNIQVEVDVVKASGNTEDNIVESLAAENLKHEVDKESSPSDAAKDLEGNGVEESASVPLDKPLKEDGAAALISEPWTYGMQNTEEVAFGWKLVMHEETNQYYYWNIETGETSWEVPAILAEGAELVTEPREFSVVEGGESLPRNLQTDPENVNDGSYPRCDGMGGNSLLAMENHETEFALSTNLVNHAEGLIHRLKGLKSSGIQLQSWEWISKYIMEIEIRLSDFKSLWAYGSSLLPFWIHSEEKLKVLEVAISDHISQLTKSGQTNEVDAEMSFCRDNGSSHPNVGRDSELNDGDRVVDPGSQIPSSSPKLDASVVQKEIEDAFVISNVNTKENIQQKKETVPTNRVVVLPVSTIEDDDMDVDMEVDDEPITIDPKSEDVFGVKCGPPYENLSALAPPGELPTIVPDKVDEVPAPPNEDWIPPPPPDAEPVPPPPPDAEPTPPPPPDDPSLPSYTPQPPYSDTSSHLPYTEQYTMSYPVSGTEYYGPTMTEIPSSNYFALSEQPQTAGSQSGQYVYTVSSTLSETTPVIVNPLVPSIYYGIAPPAPATCFFGSSGYYGESVSASSYHNTAPADGNGTPGALPEVAYSSISNKETQMLAAPISTSALSTMVDAPLAEMKVAQVQPTTTPVISQSAGAVAPSTSAPKASSKSKISKKRTIAAAPSMRSNKKVSSLVDKWKAAKEEMHDEEEDEPQSAYEMLERKRQREIEQWKARQIATGEAKDNANFQPLGGDWRDRVKRRRAKKSSVVQKSLPPETPDDSTTCSDLPPGWKSYWDENLKKEYYGNTTTMETTWTRPTK